MKHIKRLFAMVDTKFLIKNYIMSFLMMSGYHEVITKNDSLNLFWKIFLIVSGILFPFARLGLDSIKIFEHKPTYPDVIYTDGSLEAQKEIDRIRLNQEFEKPMRLAMRFITGTFVFMIAPIVGPITIIYLLFFKK